MYVAPPAWFRWFSKFLLRDDADWVVCPVGSHNTNTSFHGLGQSRFGGQKDRARVFDCEGTLPGPTHNRSSVRKYVNLSHLKFFSRVTPVTFFSPVETLSCGRQIHR